MDGFVGHYDTVARLEWWVQHFSRHTKKYVVIKGPHGVGKTMLVRLLCKKYGIELYMADLEDGEAFERSTLNLCAGQGSILGKPRRVALLVDDIDAIQNNGALVRALVKRMNASTVPLFCTCTSFEFEPAHRVQYQHMDRLSTISVYKHLQTVNQEKCFGRDDIAVKRIAKACNGDLRYALLSLEYCARVETKDADRLQMPEALERIYNGEHVDLYDLEVIYAKNGDKLMSALHREYLQKCDPRPVRRSRRRSRHGTLLGMCGLRGARSLRDCHSPNLADKLTQRKVGSTEPLSWPVTDSTCGFYDYHSCTLTGRLARWIAEAPGPLSWPVADLENLADVAAGFTDQSIITLHNRDTKGCDLAAAIIAVTIMRFVHMRRQRFPCALPKRAPMQQTTLADMWASRRHRAGV